MIVILQILTDRRFYSKFFKILPENGLSSRIRQKNVLQYSDLKMVILHNSDEGERARSGRDSFQLINNI